MIEAYLGNLQNLGVVSRQKAKEKIELKNLKELRNLDYETFQIFNKSCCDFIMNRIKEKTKQQPRLVLIQLNGVFYYIVVLEELILDPSIDYFIPTKQFSYLKSDYPIKYTKSTIIE